MFCGLLIFSLAMLGAQVDANGNLALWYNGMRWFDETIMDRAIVGGFPNGIVAVSTDHSWKSL